MRNGRRDVHVPMESLSAKSQPVLPKRTFRKDLVPGFQKANSLTEKYSQIRGTNFVTYACHFLENLKMTATFRSYPCDPPAWLLALTEIKSKCVGKYPPQGEELRECLSRRIPLTLCMRRRKAVTHFLTRKTLPKKL